MTNECLLIDHWGSANLTLVESKGSKMRIHARLSECDSINKNKRIYPGPVLREAVERIQPLIESNSLVASCDHPSVSTLLLQDACLLWNKVYFEGNVLLGEGTVLSTPTGRILSALINDGVQIGISSRATGMTETRPDGIAVIKSPLQIVTFDIVANPSSEKAYINKAYKTESLSNYPTPKYESTSINKLNADLLISYFGQCVSEKSKLLKEGLKHE